MSTPAAAEAPSPAAAAAAAAAPAEISAGPAATPPVIPTVTPAVTPAAPRCDNCGASVPGRYCGNCGQRFEPPLHSLWHFLTVAMEDVTHADSRLWRTLWALLFKPGYLTHEFLAGRRARYLPPVRLYLVLSVVFFLVAGATRSEPGGLEPSTDAGRNARECAMIVYNGWWHATLTPAMQRACLRIRADNARSLMTSIRHNLPRTMFLFLPLLAGLMLLMYWRPRHYYVEHLLLLVHNHAFAFLVLPIAWGLGALDPAASGWLGLALFLYLAWYMYRSMRSVYGQGRALTLAKLTALSFFYCVFGLTMFVLDFAYSALTLD